ncbi:autoinducer 2 ABC transporter substrate-binding protein [Amycolatopsis suaedae]|uniref:Sugar ABC transporter substrate-binding protein n=1 Tax=Amycolatopsis suaedae TaxID=2510978 RepID=A0A4Q7J3B0_9PSEU|nr:autoinducer 2 ABC transporter substrate-binding protein [Amycolatopsis suaedae]RZQ60464.1 sugar ABC transporter substrate-binding protein [Amycolatopsis suaedae]
MRLLSCRLPSLLLAAVLAVAGCDAGGEPAPGNDSPRVRIAFVPKVAEIPYFKAMDVGGRQAAETLGAEWIYRGPSTVDPPAQVQVVRSLIQERVDVIVVAPNDPAAIDTVLAEASGQGIKVLTTDTDAPNSVRELFVNQASPEGVGHTLTDALMNKTGGTGKYAIVSCGPTAANLNAWIAVQRAYTARTYPNAQIVDVSYVGEDQRAATAKAKELMAAHPDLTGLVGECTTSAPGVAQAVRDTGNIGKVFTVGVGTPQTMKPYLRDGSAAAAVLWDVENLGYLTAWAANEVAEGRPLEPMNRVSAELPAVRYTAINRTLLLGEPLLITNDNVDQFPY